MALNDVSDGDKKEKGPDKKEKLLTKVIVRRLPPTMDQETFLNQISPVPNYDYFYMVKGDAGLGENSFARAYINFTNPTDIYNFKEKFDNYVFLDNAGHEFPAVVEFAAFQKIPKRKNKVKADSKVGTIENDLYYLEFVEMINKPPTQDEKPEYSYQITRENKNDSLTPLLEFVKHKRAEKMRIREERREERKRKDVERKKFRDDERKRRFEEKSPSKQKHTTKTTLPKENKNLEEKADSELTEKVQVATKSEEKCGEPSSIKEVVEKSSGSGYYKNRDKKYEGDRKNKDVKSKYPLKKEYDKREYKNRDYKDRDYRSSTKHLDDYKTKDESKVYQKKVKKYSEKREERKIEAQKAEQKKLEQQANKDTDTATQESLPVGSKSSEGHSEDKPKENKEEIKPMKEKHSPRERRNRETESQAQKRIRNKDRPTIAIYRPGMLSKRRQNDGEGDAKEVNKKE